MQRTGPNSGVAVLIATSILAAVLGSVHGFSVFLVPLEGQYGASRALVSLTYSLALVALTVAVLLGHHIFARWRAPILVLGVGLIAGIGALLAAFAPNLMAVWLGYSLLFGAANGVGYGYGLQLAAQANPTRAGLAMGIVTAAYALGAGVAPPLFSALVSIGEFRAAMIGLAVVLFVTAPLCAGMLARARAIFADPPTRASRAKIPPRTFALLWIGYGAGVAAGLMAIGHATGIAAQSAFPGPIWIAPAAIAVFNLLGSLMAGRFADRATPVVLLGGLPMISAMAVLWMASGAGPQSVIPALAVVGFAYGGTIAAYPAVIAQMFGAADSARVYGRVFTAWGTAGLFAPWIAGGMFDYSGSYLLPLISAATLGAASSVAALILFRGRFNGPV